MKNRKDTWKSLGDYFEAMTDLTAETVKDVAKEWGEMWNAEDDKRAADSAFDAMKESIGVGVRASAKAWVATRQLMLDLAE
ncbi:MAG TPA: hypothetical protein VF115_10470 [Acidimicrobiia bacterium]